MAGLHNLKPNIRTPLPVVPARRSAAFRYAGVGGDEGEDYGRRIGKLTATVEGAKKGSKKG
jgi:hypothetical protein